MINFIYECTNSNYTYLSDTKSYIFGEDVRGHDYRYIELPELLKENNLLIMLIVELVVLIFIIGFCIKNKRKANLSLITFFITHILLVFMVYKRTWLCVACDNLGTNIGHLILLVVSAAIAYTVAFIKSDKFKKLGQILLYILIYLFIQIIISLIIIKILEINSFNYYEYEAIITPLEIFAINISLFIEILIIIICKEVRKIRRNKNGSNI